MHKTSTIKYVPEFILFCITIVNLKKKEKKKKKKKKSFKLKK